MSGGLVTGGLVSRRACGRRANDRTPSTPPLSFYRPDALPAAQPTASEEGHPACKTEWWVRGYLSGERRTL